MPGEGPVSTAADARSKPSLYFVNAPVDFALIGGVSLALYVGLSLFHDGARSGTVLLIAAFLTWVGNWPHFAATNYRLYRSRETVSQYPITALMVPVLVLAGVVASVQAPQAFAPYFVLCFLLWSPYHFSGQSCGITLIYARRAGLPVGKLERWALFGFVYMTFIAPMVRGHVGTTPIPFYSVAVPRLGVPAWVAQVTDVLLWVAAAGFAAAMLRWALRERRMIPAIVLLPAVTQLVWFEFGSRLPSFSEFVPFFHGVQYLLIAWCVQLKEKMDEQGIAPSPRYVGGESLRWAVGIFLGGAGLFWVAPRLLADTGVPLLTATAIVISAVQIHHFFVDGVIWKLKNPRVRTPLMVNLGEMARAVRREGAGMAAPLPVRTPELS